MSNPFNPNPKEKTKAKPSYVPKTFAEVIARAVTPKKPPEVKVPMAPKEPYTGTVKERVIRKPGPTPAEMFLAGTKTPVPPKAQPPAKPRYTFPTPAEMEIERAKDMERAGYPRPGLRDPQQTYTAQRRRKIDTEEHGMSKLDALLPNLDAASRWRAKQFMVAELGGSNLGELKHIDGRILNGSGTKYKDAEDVARRFAQLYQSGKGAEIESAIKSFVNKRQKHEELKSRMEGLQFSIRKSVIDKNPYAATYLSEEDRQELAQLPLGDNVDLNSAVWSKISENAKNTVNNALGLPNVRAAEERYKAMASDPNMSPLERGVAGIGAFGSMLTGVALSQAGDVAGMAADIPGEVINVAETERGDLRKYGAIANLVGKAGAVAATAAGAGQGVRLAMQPAATLSGRAANAVKGIARIGYEVAGGGPVPEKLKTAGEKLAEAVKAGDITPDELRSVADEVSQAVKLDPARVDDFAKKIRKGAIEAGANIDDADAKAAATIVVAMEAKTKGTPLDRLEIRGERMPNGADAGPKVEGLEGAKRAKKDQIAGAGKKAEEPKTEPDTVNLGEIDAELARDASARPFPERFEFPDAAKWDGGAIDDSDIRGRGYDGYSQSVNATRARERGEMPWTEFKKWLGPQFNGLTANDLHDVIGSVEHHTSKHFNATRFFDPGQLYRDVDPVNDIVSYHAELLVKARDRRAAQEFWKWARKEVYPEGFGHKEMLSRLDIKELVHRWQDLGGTQVPPRIASPPLPDGVKEISVNGKRRFVDARYGGSFDGTSKTIIADAGGKVESEPASKLTGSKVAMDAPKPPSGAKATPNTTTPKVEPAPAKAVNSAVAPAPKGEMKAPEHATDIEKAWARQARSVDKKKAWSASVRLKHSMKAREEYGVGAGDYVRLEYPWGAVYEGSLNVGTNGNWQIGIASATISEAKITKIDTPKTEAPAAGNAPRETPGIVVTEAGGRALPGYARDGTKKYSMEWRVMSLDDVVQSHDPQSFGPNPRFPVAEDLQPRDRTRTESRVNVQKMAQTLDADLLLDDTKALTDGSPIVDARGIVEHGNGRTMAVKLAQLEHPDKYEAYVAELRQRFPEAAEIENPVLVRVRTSELDPAEQKSYSRIGSTPTGQGMSTTETAMADAQSLDDSFWNNIEVIGDNFEDTITAAANRGKITSFLAKIPESERAEFLDASGHLSEAGVSRIKNAAVLFLLGEDGSRFAAKAMESGEMSRRVYNGLVAALPSLLKYKTPNLVRTLNDGLTAWQDFVASPFKTMEMYLAQQTMAPLSPRAKYVLEKLGAAAGPRGSGKQVAAEFNAMAELNKAIKESGSQDSMFGADEIVDLNEFKLFSRKKVSSMSDDELDRWLKYAKGWGADASEGLRQFNVAEDAIRVITAKAGVPYKPAATKDINTGLFGESFEQLDLKLFKNRYAPKGTATTGEYVWDADQKRGIVTLFDGADITTAVHEPAHHLLMHMPLEMLKPIMAAAGVDTEKRLDQMTADEYTRLQEYWARGVENTLYDGRVKDAPAEVQDAFAYAGLRFQQLYGEAGVDLPDGVLPTMLTDAGKLNYEPVAEMMANMMAGKMRPLHKPPARTKVSPALSKEPAGARMVDFNGKRVALSTLEDEAAYDRIAGPARKDIRKLADMMRQTSDPVEKSRLATEMAAAQRNFAEDLDSMMAEMKRRQMVEAGIVEDLDAKFAALQQQKKVSDETPIVDSKGPAHLKTGFSDEALKMSLSETLRAVFFDDAIRAVTAREALEKAMVQDLTKGSMKNLVGTALDISEAINKQTRLGHKIEEYVRWGIKSENGVKLGPGVMEIRQMVEDSGIDPERWQWYRRALRENEIYNQGRGGLIDQATTEKNSEYIFSFLKSLTEEQTDSLTKIDLAWDEMADAHLSLFERYGLKAKGWADEIRQDNLSYFPLHRTKDETERTMEMLNPSKLASPGMKVFRAKGGHTYVDGFMAMASEIERAVRIGEATRAYLPFFKEMAERSKAEMSRYLKEVTENAGTNKQTAPPQLLKWVEDVTPTENEASRTAAWGDSADLDPLADEFIEGVDPILRLVDEGKERVYRIDPYLWAAIRTSQPQTPNAVMTVFRLFAGAARAGTTGPLNPMFQLVFNPIIDGGSAAITQGVTPAGWARAWFEVLMRGARPYSNPKTLKQKISTSLSKYRGANYDEAAMAGAFTNSKGIRDHLPDEWMFDPTKRNIIQEKIEKLTNAKGIRLLRGGYEALQYLGQTMEETTKLAAFNKRQGEALALNANGTGKRLKDLTPMEIEALKKQNQGASAMHAVSTMNFGRQGLIGKFFASAGIPYAGVPYQVMLSHAKAMRRDPQGYVKRALVLVGGPAVIEHVLYHDDPEWADMPNYLRHGAVMFRDGIWRGKPHEGDWFAIRIPEEVGIIVRGGIFNALDKKSPQEIAALLSGEEAKKFIPSMPTALALLKQQQYYMNTGGVTDYRFDSQKAYPLRASASEEAKAKNRYKQTIQQVDTAFGATARTLGQVVGFKLGYEPKAPSIFQRFRPQPHNLKPKMETEGPKTIADILKRAQGEKPKTVAEIIKGIKRQ